MRDSFDVIQRIDGDAHPRTLVARINLGFLYVETGQHPQAVELLEPHLMHARRVFVGDHTHSLGAYLAIFGVTCTRLNRFADAETALSEAHTIYLSVHGNAHPFTLRCHHGVIDLYDHWHEHEPGGGYAALADNWRERLP